MDTVIDATIEYTRERKAFGKSILDNQVVHFRLAELRTEVAALRALTYSAVEQYVSGKDVTKLASMAKLKCGPTFPRGVGLVPAVLGRHGLHGRQPRRPRLSRLAPGVDRRRRRRSDARHHREAGGDSAGPERGLSMSDPTTLALRRDGAVLHVTLNRPEVRNAMSLAMVREIVEVLSAAEKDGTDARDRVAWRRWATSRAGADLKDMAGARARLGEDPEAIVKVNAAFGELCNSYAGTGLAVVAAVEGAVMGGGFGSPAWPTWCSPPRIPCSGFLRRRSACCLRRSRRSSSSDSGYSEAKRLAVTGARHAREALQIRLVHEVHAAAGSMPPSRASSATS